MIFCSLKPQPRFNSKKCVDINENACVCQNMTNVNLARILQNHRFRTEIGWAGKNRKEIELSLQKSKNGISPMPNFTLRIPDGLQNRTAGRFTIATDA